MKELSLKSLKNVGPATLADLVVLGISSVQQLAQQDASEMYERLQILTGKRHDPCVWDVFTAIIHEAKTGEKTPWWEWTPKRKEKYVRSNSR